MKQEATGIGEVVEESAISFTDKLSAFSERGTEVIGRGCIDIALEFCQSPYKCFTHVFTYSIAPEFVLFVVLLADDRPCTLHTSVAFRIGIATLSFSRALN